MLLAMSATDAAVGRKLIPVKGDEYGVSGYIGAAPVRGVYLEGNEVNDNGLPQGFLVEQPAGAITRPHFHEVDQFQVIVDGDGKLGKGDIRPVTVHFAGGHTPYGPLIAGDAGVTYFTLRAAWDPGAKYMPESRDKLKPVRRRYRLAPAVSLSDAAALAARDTVALEPIMEPEEDGLAGYVLRLGAGGKVNLPDPATGAGQYLVVVNGSLAHDGGDMPRWSCLYQTADEAPLPARAGAAGLELLILRFPKKV
jgi:hypothetical protein